MQCAAEEFGVKLRGLMADVPSALGQTRHNVARCIRQGSMGYKRAINDQAHPPSLYGRCLTQPRARSMAASHRMLCLPESSTSYHLMV